jgi:hypothetical protein
VKNGLFCVQKLWDAVAQFISARLGRLVLARNPWATNWAPLSHSRIEMARLTRQQRQLRAARALRLQKQPFPVLCKPVKKSRKMIRRLLMLKETSDLDPTQTTSII